jgi:hypothetical protein
MKHGLSFEVAIRAFDDPAAAFEFNSTVGNEDRQQVMGRIDGSVLIVLAVYTIKQGQNDGQEIYRIISARKASPSERERYAEAAH